MCSGCACDRCPQNTIARIEQNFETKSINALDSVKEETDIVADEEDDKIEQLDPFEDINRKIFVFNMFFDKIFIRPIVGFYDFFIPSCVQSFITNAVDLSFSYLSIVNSLLQLEFEKAIMHTTRSALNLTFGMCGVVDVSDKIGLRIEFDGFGKTMKHWGVPQGCFLMIPIIGPSCTRESLGMSVDAAIDIFVLDPKHMKWLKYKPIKFGLDYINRRNAYSGAIEEIEEFFDPYAIMRKFYYEKNK
ncbi:VacJ family lipoprotein [Candidatus Hydrogenosomobacter endosymbioticus]|uniref:Uncharacterized protein n=1 Tax=Candidatus Hydrogenosomobacter endosymbioticus TaxID=2558174 RepID=A0ABN6L2G9_9PROT|nr:VacJ family lipoprotein [Candidatus Hydrogenosomobacter endosymbioticus]BDB96044.1 hypothetical protein HYD_1770 [Candidatus Hydrogenosomobacter endosymbioticus]